MSNGLPPYGTLDGYRMPIADLLAKVETYARLGQDFIEVPDDAGLNHAVRCLTIHTRVAIDLLRELKRLKETQQARVSGATAR